MAKFVNFTREEDGESCYINPETVTTVMKRHTSGSGVYSRVVLTSGGFMEVLGTPAETVQKLSIS